MTKSRRSPGFRAPALALAVLLLPAVALAAASGEHSVEHAAPSLGLLALNFVNFAIYAYILKRFAWPPISKYLLERRESIVASLESAARAKAEAEAIKADYEERLRGLEADAEKARAEVLAIAENEARKLLEQARQSAERIRTDARLVAEQELTRARRLLQEESADLVASVASDLITKNLTADDQAKFVAEFVSDAASSAGASR